MSGEVGRFNLLMDVGDGNIQLTSLWKDTHTDCTDFDCHRDNRILIATEITLLPARLPE